MPVQVVFAIALGAVAVLAYLVYGVAKYGAVRSPKLKKPPLKYDKAAFMRDAADLTIPLDEILEKCDGAVPREDDRRVVAEEIVEARKRAEVESVYVPRGVQYIVETLPQRPVLRPIRHPLYDTLIIRENGLMHGISDRVNLFTAPRNFPDGASKGPQDTNMILSGQLGTPLEYDIVAIDMHVVDYAKAEDVRKVLSALTCRWFFGSCTCWLTIPAGGFEPYLCNGAAGDALGLSKNLDEYVEEPQKQVSAFMNMGAVWPFYRQVFTTPDRLARRITSCESFWLEVIGKCAPLSGPVALKFLTRGVLYQQF